MASWSEVFTEVHASVALRYVVGVSIEGKRLALGELTQPSLAALAPAGMIHGRIHVGVKTVLRRIGNIPGGRRLFLHELDLDDGLDAFEAVLPGHDEPDRRPVLIGQRLAIHAEAEQRQRMHGLVHAQSFDVGKRDTGLTGAEHYLSVVDGLEGHALRG